MHLVINASELGRRRGGNESYLLGLLGGLVAIADSGDVRTSLIVANEGAGLAQDDRWLRSFDVVNAGRYRRLPFLLWQQTTILRRLRPDWYISTFFLPPMTPCHAAVLIHDMSFRTHPEYFPSSIAAYMRLFTGLAIRRADIVIALSEFTRREVLHYYPAAEGKMVVVYPGVGDEFTPDGDPADGDGSPADDAVLASLDVQQPYLLAVGNIHPRKNLDRLLAAWVQLRDAAEPVPRLLWAGLDRWSSNKLLMQAQAAGVQILGFVAPAHLPALYRRAEALAYPSLYEGFGLPPLEAMACGTPVLTANTTSLPEAVGDAAVTVDPTDVNALADGLKQVLFDAATRRGLRARGLAHARRFRWDRTADGVLEALRAAPVSLAIKVVTP